MADTVHNDYQPPHQKYLSKRIILSITILAATITLLLLIAGFRKRDNSSTQPNTNLSNNYNNWKIFTNTKIGFSIKYPPAFIVDTTDRTITYTYDESGKAIFDLGPTIPLEHVEQSDGVVLTGLQSGYEPRAILNIQVNPNDLRGLSIQCATDTECMKISNKISERNSNDFKIVHREIFGRKVQGFAEVLPGEQNSERYFVVSKGKVWEIYINKVNLTVTEDKYVDNIFNIMLSSIKDIPVTHNKKFTFYTSNKYPLSFEYPKDWELSTSTDGSTVMLTSSYPKEDPNIPDLIIRVIKTSKDIDSFIFELCKSIFTCDYEEQILSNTIDTKAGRSFNVNEPYSQSVFVVKKGEYALITSEPYPYFYNVSDDEERAWILDYIRPTIRLYKDTDKTHYNWVPYRSSQLGFSINYPFAFDVTESDQTITFDKNISFTISPAYIYPENCKTSCLKILDDRYVRIGERVLRKIIYSVATVEQIKIDYIYPYQRNFYVASYEGNVTNLKKDTFEEMMLTFWVYR